MTLEEAQVAYDTQENIIVEGFKRSNLALCLKVRNDNRGAVIGFSDVGEFFVSYWAVGGPVVQFHGGQKQSRHGAIYGTWQPASAPVPPLVTHHYEEAFPHYAAAFAWANKMCDIVVAS